jgi:glycosyltransferase involved in cell wall biosynthesis
MKIDCFTITYNEERIVNFFIKHYSRFCDNINIIDNYSTDNTAGIAKLHKDKNVHLKYYNSNNSLDDSVYLDIKNNCWRESTADYVIVVDCDELLYHEDIRTFLLETNKPVYRPQGFDMVSDKFPDHCDLLTEGIKDGIPAANYSKMCIFSPSKVSSINYSLGCHSAQPQDKSGNYINPDSSSELKLLHYKNLSFEYRYSKHLEYSERMSDFNKRTGAGIHYNYDKDKQYSEFLDIFNRREQII